MEQKKKFEHSCCNAQKVLSFDTFIYGFSEVFWQGCAAVEYYAKTADIRLNSDVRALCFVHGDEDDLHNGKKCVVRDQVVCFTPMGEKDDEGHEKWQERAVERAVIHMPGGRVILVIGHTTNGNTIIVMK